MEEKSPKVTGSTQDYWLASRMEWDVLCTGFYFSRFLLLQTIPAYRTFFQRGDTEKHGLHECLHREAVRGGVDCPWHLAVSVLL